MDFLYTTYYYPLQAPLQLSKQHGFYLDNPRSKQEVQEAVEYLNKFRNSESYFPLMAKSKKDFYTIEKYLLRFRDYFKGYDKYVDNFFIDYRSDKALDYIARMMIIARFNDEGAKEYARKEHRKMKRAKEFGFILLDDDHPALVNSEKLENFVSLISLLTYPKSESYWGNWFLINSDPPKTMDDDPWYNFLMFSSIAPHFSKGKLRMYGESWIWHFFPTVQKTLFDVAKQLDEALAQEEDGKLLYIGNILKIAGRDTHDVKVKILLLTSILELLLTHNPDFNRFNIEDSINKQFQLKTNVLLYLNNSSIDLNATKNRLKTIYQIRSAIAHGNFEEIVKVKKNAKKKTSERDPIEECAVDLYCFIRAALEEYLKDRVFFEFLKNA